MWSWGPQKLLQSWSSSSSSFFFVTLSPYLATVSQVVYRFNGTLCHPSLYLERKNMWTVVGNVQIEIQFCGWRENSLSTPWSGYSICVCWMAVIGCQGQENNNTFWRWWWWRWCWWWFSCIAVLKRQFEVPPYSQQVARGSQVEMRCHPPRGRPPPKTYWKFNGRTINTDIDKNFMITGEGHLILVSARLTDTGNYTCVAENIANMRFSDPATMTVYGKSHCKHFYRKRILTQQFRTWQLRAK